MLKKFFAITSLLFFVVFTSFCCFAQTTTTTQAPATVTTTTSTVTTVTPGTGAAPTPALTTPQSILDRAVEVAREVGVDPALVAQILAEQPQPVPAPTPTPQPGSPGVGQTTPPTAKKAGFPWWLVLLALAVVGAIAGATVLVRRRGHGAPIYPVLLLCLFATGTAMAQTPTQMDQMDNDATKVRQAVRLNTESLSILNGRLQKVEKKPTTPSGMDRREAVSRFVELPKYRTNGWAAGIEKQLESMVAEIESLKNLVQSLQAADVTMDSRITDLRDSVPTVGELTNAVVSGVATATDNFVTKVQNLGEEVDEKADRADLSDLQTKVENLGEEVDEKADGADLSDLQTQVQNLGEDIEDIKETSSQLSREISDLRQEFGSDIVWILDTMSMEATQVGTTGRRIPVVGGAWNFLRGGQAVKPTSTQKKTASDIATRLSDVRGRYFGEGTTTSSSSK